MNFHACQAQHTFLILEWNELHGVGRRSHQGGHQINRERVCEEPHHERAAAHIAEGKCVLKNGMKFIIKYRLFLNSMHHRTALELYHLAQKKVHKAEARIFAINASHNILWRKSLCTCSACTACVALNFTSTFCYDDVSWCMQFWVLQSDLT